MYEEIFLDLLTRGAIGFLGFIYSENFLTPKFDNRKKTLILWIIIFVLGQTLYENLTEHYQIYNKFSYIIPNIFLIFILQIYFFEKNISRQIFSITSFTAGLSILRFIASPLAHALLGLWSPLWENLINYILTNELFSMKIKIIEYSNRITLFIVLTLCRFVQLGVFLVYLKLITKNFVTKDYKLNFRETLFLLTPCVSIFLTDLTLRIMAYSVDNSSLMLIYDRVPETVALLPAVSLFLLGFAISSVITLKGIVDGKEDEKKRLLLENSIKDAHKQIKEIENIYSDIRGLKHDLRDHIAGITAYVKNIREQNKEIDAYLTKMENTVSRLDFAYNTGNPITDAILHRFKNQAEQKNININFNFFFPKNNFTDAYDLSVILNNALSNAMEAVETANNKIINLKSYNKGNLFFIEIENTFKNNIIWKGNLPITTKNNKNLHGLGIGNIKRIAQKYNGEIDIKINDKRFVLTIMLYKKIED